MTAAACAALLVAGSLGPAAYGASAEAVEETPIEEPAPAPAGPTPEPEPAPEPEAGPAGEPEAAPEPETQPQATRESDSEPPEPQATGESEPEPSEPEVAPEPQPSESDAPEPEAPAQTGASEASARDTGAAEPAQSQQSASAAATATEPATEPLAEQAAAAVSEDTTQDLEVEIGDVVVGEQLASGLYPVEVTGQVSLGPLVLDVSSLYVTDVSGSTSSRVGDCNGDGIADASDDLNGDGSPGTVLDCEISGALALNGSIVGTTVDVGVVPFASGAQVSDVDPAEAGIQPFTTPQADRDGDGVRDVEQVLLGLTAGGGTDFNDALAEVTRVFAQAPPDNRRIAFFLSDGVASLDQSEGSPLAAATAAGIQVNTFSVGSGASGCEQGEPLRAIADATGGTCTRVEDPTALSALLGDLSPIGVDRVLVRVGDGDPVRAMLDPFGNFSATVFGTLLPGANVVTVTAFDDAGGSATAARALPAVQAPADAPATPPQDPATPTAPVTNPPPAAPGAGPLATGDSPASEEQPGGETGADAGDGPAVRGDTDRGDGRGNAGPRPPRAGGPGEPPGTGAGPIAPAAELDDAGIVDDLVPELGESVVLRPASGTVFVRLPSGELVRMTGPIEVPVGSSIDTRRGEVALTSVRDTSGVLQTARFSEGIFVVEQREADDWITELRLKGGDLPLAGSERVSHGGDRHECRGEQRRLWGDAPDRARFRTRGRYSAAAVRGTEWLTQDCENGTVTSVREGRVTVRDLVRDIVRVLGAGDSYLAQDEQGAGAVAPDESLARPRI